MELMKTYRLINLLDFIFYLFDQDQEERLYNQWLHTSMQQSFADFKKAQQVKKIRKSKADKPVTKEDEQKMLAFATQFIKPNKPESEVK